MTLTPTSDFWVQTNEGNVFTFLDPKPEQIKIADIASALARIPRFGAKTLLTENTYSVAQHSVLVSQLCGPRNALAGLLHDAAEGLLGFDMPTPVKACLPDFREIEGRIDRAVFDRFGIPWERMAEIKIYDLIALQIEKHWLMSPEAQDWNIDWPWDEAECEALGPITPLSWRDAVWQFMARFAELYEPQFERPALAMDGGWEWDPRRCDFFRPGPLGESVEKFDLKTRFPHIQLVEIGV